MSNNVKQVMVFILLFSSQKKASNKRGFLIL
jgi:hypothetical protein